MRNYKIKFVTMLGVVMAILLSAIQVSAVGVLDTDRDVTVSLVLEHSKKPIEGAKFSLYRFADVDAYGNYAVCKDFKAYPVNFDEIDQDGWQELALTLSGYVERDKIKPVDSGTTDKNGRLNFPQSAKSLSRGMYLVIGSSVKENGYIYSVAPFMIAAPDIVNNSWNYNVTVKPKCEREKDTDVTRKVIIVWDDKGYESKRPKKTEVQLLRNSVVYTTVILSSDNDWRYTWKELDGNYEWTIVEKELADYTTSVKQNGATTVITNSLKQTETKPIQATTKPGQISNLPQTGVPWWPIPVLLTIGLLFIVMGILVKKDSRSDK